MIVRSDVSVYQIFQRFRLGESEFPGRWIAKLNFTSSSLSALAFPRSSSARPSLPFPLLFRCISALSSLFPPLWVASFPIVCSFSTPLPSRALFPRKLDSCFQFCAGPRKGSRPPAFLCFFYFLFGSVETFLPGVFSVSSSSSASTGPPPNSDLLEDCPHVDLSLLRPGSLSPLRVLSTPIDR